MRAGADLGRRHRRHLWRGRAGRGDRVGLLGDEEPGRKAYDKTAEERCDHSERDGERATAGRYRGLPIVEQRTGIRMVEARVEL